MHLSLRLQPCRTGDGLPLFPAALPGADVWPAHCLTKAIPRPMTRMRVGTRLYTEDGTALFCVTGRIWLTTPPGLRHAHAYNCPILTALTDIAPLPNLDDAVRLEVRKEGRSLAWVTLSDKGSQGMREDLSGPAIADLAAAHLPLCHSQGFLLPDEASQLRALLTDLALNQGYDLICTTGGTGLSPRDITPQVTAALLDLPLPGFSQAMLAASLDKTPHAAISRAVAGVLGQSIIINLPGSRKGVQETWPPCCPPSPMPLTNCTATPPTVEDNSMRTPFGQFADICRMIKIEHSVFALPYAWAGAVLAARGLPPLRSLIFLTIGMVAVRSFAMAFNRLVDLPFDRDNPRTMDRPLVTGDISVAQTWAFCGATALIFIIACACLNSLCFWLAVPALLFAAAYSLLKRFTALCHFWLGATLGLAPLAGWISVNPAGMDLSPVLLFLAVTFWVGAFDIYYAFQDLDFDLAFDLRSVPSVYGPDTALALAAFSHVMTAIFLLLTGLAAHLSWPWYAICLGIGVLLLVEHRLMRPQDLRHVNTAFFTLNGIISPVVLVGVILGIYI